MISKIPNYIDIYNPKIFRCLISNKMALSFLRYLMNVCSIFADDAFHFIVEAKRDHEVWMRARSFDIVCSFFIFFIISHISHVRCKFEIRYL